MKLKVFLAQILSTLQLQLIKGKGSFLIEIEIESRISSLSDVNKFSKVSDMGGSFIVIVTTLVGVIFSLICLTFLLKTRLNGIVKTMFFILAVNNIVGLVINTIINGMMLSNGERNRTTCSWFLISGFFVMASNRIYSSMISIHR